MDLRGNAMRVCLTFLLASANVIGARQLSRGEGVEVRVLEDTGVGPATSEGFPSQGEETVIRSGGDLFQVDGCPYAISFPKALEIYHDNRKPGNTIKLVKHGDGRTGNHFMTISAYFAMGYCCRSRLLTLPQTDSVLPTEDGTEFVAGNSWYTFSDVTLPWSEYNDLRDNERACRPLTEDAGQEAFNYRKVDASVLRCMNQVYLRGCESQYLGNLVDKKAICPERDPHQKGAGSLAIHIRSGDIFAHNGAQQQQHLSKFGQPPLQFYLHAVASKPWDEVNIMTMAKQDILLNPTFKALEMMATTGVLGPNVRAHKNRDLFDDVKDMLCADGLAIAKSSLSFFTFAHSKATAFYIPGICGPGFFRRMKNPPVKASFDNATLLLLEKPYAEVFGVKWLPSGKQYSVFGSWDNTWEQKNEMVTYGDMEALQQC